MKRKLIPPMPTTKEISDAGVKRVVSQCGEYHAKGSDLGELMLLSSCIARHASDLEKMGKQLARCAVEIEEIRRRIRDSKGES